MTSTALAIAPQSARSAEQALAGAVRVDDIAACLAMLKKGSKSFFAASRLLPKRMHIPTFALYAFCRVADDEVDLAVDASCTSAAAKRSAEALALERMRERLVAVYAGTPSDCAVDRMFAATVAAYQIPQALPAALLEGMQWDSEGRDYESVSELIAYCARVASSVGVMMTLLMGPRDPLVLARAADLGVAMQLTNIARDVGEDARMGRVYLPGEWLRGEGLSAAELIRVPQPSAALSRVVARLLAEAEMYYVRSETGISALPADCRTSIYAARLIYSSIGHVIARRGYDSISTRASTSSVRKIWLLLRAYVGAKFAFPPLDPAPVAAELAFLVEYGRAAQLQNSPAESAAELS